MIAQTIFSKTVEILAALAVQFRRAERVVKAPSLSKLSSYTHTPVIALVHRRLSGLRALRKDPQPRQRALAFPPNRLPDDACIDVEVAVKRGGSACRRSRSTEFRGQVGASHPKRLQPPRQLLR